jgi:hypothetical protein
MISRKTNRFLLPEFDYRLIKKISAFLKNAAYRISDDP